MTKTVRSIIWNDIKFVFIDAEDQISPLHTKQKNILLDEDNVWTAALDQVM